jgi:ATP-binding protein involved in chromosome partitioning
MRNIVPVISGKGGVGKSSVAVNLAVSLANTGAKVALIDCDFYGPSIPTLMGGGQVIPDHEGKLIPPVKFGVKYISLGFFLQNPDDPVIWRGPMFNKALVQLFQDVSWGDVDYCIVDMPPGTGDAQISFSQAVQCAGAVIVTTPQEVALADVRKSINMLSKVNIPVLGIVENMSGLKLPDGSIQYIFGQGGGEKLSTMFNAPLLAQIPIEVSIREGGDTGLPVAAQDTNPASKIFAALALRLQGILDKNSKSQPQVQIFN